MKRRQFVSALVVGLIALGVGAVVLAAPGHHSTRATAPPSAAAYMPVPGSGEGEQFGAMDTYWNDRLTYPTGHFNPAWLRAAKTQDARIASRRPRFGGEAPASWTALGPKPEKMTGCTGCYDYGFTEGRINAIAVDPTTTTQGTSSRTRPRRRRGLEDDELLQQLHRLERHDRRPPHLHARDRHPQHRPERPQHGLRGHGRPQLRLLLDGQPGHPQVDRRRRALDGARRGRVRPGLHRARRPVPAVRRGRQGARRPERQPEGPRRNEEGALHLLRRRDELDRARARRTASRPSARTSRASS